MAFINAVHSDFHLVLMSTDTDLFVKSEVIVQRLRTDHMLNRLALHPWGVALYLADADQLCSYITFLSSDGFREFWIVLFTR